jgi:excisionase family DNA binding protein
MYAENSEEIEITGNKIDHTSGGDSSETPGRDMSIAEAYSKALAAYRAYLRAYIDASKLGSKLTIKKAADFLGVHRTTLRRWTDNGLIEHKRSGHKRERIYLPEYIIKFLEKKVYPILEADSEALKKQTIEAYVKAIDAYKYYLSTYIDASKLGPKLTLKKAAKILGVHTNTLRNWSNEGRIHSYRFGVRGERRFSLEELLESSSRGGQTMVHATGGPALVMLGMKDVADVLHVHENTVRNWADQGSLRCYRIGKRRDRKFDPVDIKDFAEKHGYPEEDLVYLQKCIERNLPATTS